MTIVSYISENGHKNTFLLHSYDHMCDLQRNIIIQNDGNSSSKLALFPASFLRIEQNLFHAIIIISNLSTYHYAKTN